MESSECKHDYQEHYYGWECKYCGHFIADGQEPWMPYDIDEEESFGAWDIPDFDDMGQTFVKADEVHHAQKEEWEPDFDCGFVPGMGCQKAGSEECEFECPYREAYYATLKR